MSPVTEGKTQVLFIAGMGRSGSTVLQNVLGQIDGFFAVGELRELWQRGLVGNWLCGCGVPFDQCDVWRQVMERANAMQKPLDPLEMSALTDSFRNRHLALGWIPVIRRRQLSRLRPYTDRLGDLYAAIRDVTGARVIVDSSKNPSYGYLLESVPNLDVSFLHLIRDAPAVSYSWTKRKMWEPGKPTSLKSNLSSALRWNARNLTAELFLPRQATRRMKIRYEDMMLDPRGAVDSIVQWLGVPEASLPFASSHEAVFSRPNHSVFGNVVRFQQGSVTLARDDRWLTDFARSNRWFVNTVTWPLRYRYGYTRGKLRAVSGEHTG